MDQRRAAGAAGALLALAACFAYSAAAPTTSDHTGLDLYNGSEGCYYNFQYYGEGDRIMTNEPCLNCTCHNRMLMCYLRVCPFTKPIGQDCTIEKRADQCCPIVTCPDVPVDLLTSTSTSSPAEYGATGLGKVDKYGCSINGRYFSEGSKVPSTPNKPCEHCYCIRNMTTCVMQECTLHVDGCTPIYHKDVCCPVRYSCDHQEDEIPLLDDMTTTVRPTPGFILTTTTLSSVTQMTQDCVHDDHIFSDGAFIKTEKACEHCYCMKGDIVCVVQECGTPMENEGKNCTALPPRDGQCCPDTYICEGDGIPTEVTETSAPSHEFITPYYEVEKIEGSGTEPNEKPDIDVPSWVYDVEHSGDNEPIDTEMNKTPVPTEELTTEPDKSLNTVPHLPDEEFRETEYKATTHIQEFKISGPTTVTHKEAESTTESIITTSTLRASSKFKEEDNIVTTEKTFRRDDEGTLGIKITTQKYLESEGTTLSPDLSTESIKTYPEQKHNLTVQELEHLPEVTSEHSKEFVTEAVTEAFTSSPEINESATDLSSEKPLDISTTPSSPSRIPGEGDCLYNGKTFNNNSIVPSENNCQINCLCVSSIIKCENVICSSPPDLIDNCQPMYDSPDSCCPTYVCPPKETVPPQAHNQMAGTQSPVLKPSHECSGDLNCEVKEQTIPAKECSTDSCSSPPETCGDNKCTLDEIVKQEPIVEQDCSKKGNCEQAQLPDDNISQCVGDSCSTPEKGQPASQDCKDEKCEIETDKVTECKDESCRRKATPTEIKDSSCTESSCPVHIPSISQATTEKAVLETEPISSTEKIHTHDVLPDIQENFTDEPEIHTEYPGVYPTEISGGSTYEPQTKPNEPEKVTATILSENETELDTKIPIISLPETLGTNTEKLPIITTDASFFPADKYGNEEKPLPTNDDQKMFTTEKLLLVTNEIPNAETEENTSITQGSPTSVPKIQTYVPEKETITKIPEVSITTSAPLGTISPENPTIETLNLTEEPGSKTSETDTVTDIPMITTMPLNKVTTTFDTEKQSVTAEHATTQSTVTEGGIEQQQVTNEQQLITAAQETSSKVADQGTEQKIETTAEESSSKVPELSNEPESVTTVAESSTKVPEVDTDHQLVTAIEESSSNVPEAVTEQQSVLTAEESSSKIPEVDTKQQSVTVAETSTSVVPEVITVTPSSEEFAESTKFSVPMPEDQTLLNETPAAEHTTKEPHKPKEASTTEETTIISEEELISISPEKHTINPEEQVTKSVEATTTEKLESSSLESIDVTSVEQAASKSTTEETINVSTEDDTRIKTTNILFTVTQPTSESTERLPVITEQTGTVATESSIFVKEIVSKTPEQLETMTQPEQLTSESTERLPITTERIESIITETSTFFKETSKRPEQLETFTESQEMQPKQPISQKTEQPFITEETGGKTTDKFDIVTPPEQLTSISPENLPTATEQIEHITTESITSLKEITSKSPVQLVTVTKSQEAQPEQPISETTEYQHFTTEQTVSKTTGELDIVTHSEQLSSESTERLPITIEQTESITSESSTYFKEITSKSPELLETATQSQELQTDQPISKTTESQPITIEPTVIGSPESMFKETSSKLPAKDVSNTQIVAEEQLSTSGEETSTKAIVHETSAPEQTTSQSLETLVTDTNPPEKIPTVTPLLPDKTLTDKPVTATTDEVSATAIDLQTASPATQEFITEKQQTISSEEPERKATAVFVTTTENVFIVTEPQIVMKPDEEKLVTLEEEETSKLPEPVTATETPKDIAQELPITKIPEADIAVSELLPTTLIIEESTSKSIETVVPVTERKEIIKPGESLNKAPESTKQEEPVTTHDLITTSSDEAVNVAAVTDRLSSTTVKPVTQPFEESTTAVTQDKEVIPIGPYIKPEKPTTTTEIQEAVTFTLPVSETLVTNMFTTDVSKNVVTEAPEKLSTKVTESLISEEPQTTISEGVSAVVTKATSFEEIVTKKPELEVSTLPTIAEIGSKPPEEEEVTETQEKLSSVELTSNTPESLITVKDEQAATYSETSSKVPQELATSTEAEKDITPEISTKVSEAEVEISSKPPEEFATVSQTEETVKSFEPTTKIPNLFVTVTEEKPADLVGETSSHLPETQTTVELTEKSIIPEEIISEEPEKIVTASEKIATTQEFEEFATTVKQEKSSEAPISATTVMEGTNTDNLEGHVTDNFVETKPPSFPKETIKPTTSTEKSISEIPQAYPITTEEPSSGAIEFITPENEKLPSTSEVYTSNKMPEEQVTISWTQETNTVEEKPSETPILKETEKQQETTVGKVPDSESEKILTSKPAIIQTTEPLPSSSEVSTLLVETSQETKEQTTVTEANKVIKHEEEPTSIPQEIVSVPASTEELESVTISTTEQQTISFSVETSSKLPEQIATTTETQLPEKDMTTQEVTFVEETSSQSPELQVTISRAEQTTLVPSVTNTEQAVTIVEETSSKETEKPHVLTSQEPFDITEETATSSTELSSQIPEGKVTIPSTLLGGSETSIGDEIISSDNKTPVSTSVHQDITDVTETYAPITEINSVQVIATAEPPKITILETSSTTPEAQELVTVTHESEIPPKEVTKPENDKIGPTILQESAVAKPGVESSSEYSAQPEQYPTEVPTTIRTNDVVTQIPVVSSSTMYESETTITSSGSQEIGKPGEEVSQTELTPYVEVSTPNEKYDTLSTETIPHKITKEPIIEESQKTTVPTELGKPLLEDEPNNITEVQKERPSQASPEGPTNAEKPADVLEIQGHPLEEHVPTHEPTMPEEELIPVTTNKIPTTTKTDEKPSTLPSLETFKPDEKPSEMHPTPATPEPTEDIPAPEEPSSAPHGYGQEPDYGEDEQPFGPGTCRYGGKVYVSAQQIPRDDPCDFCFCFRSDIICLQQSCPPPIHGCHEEPIQGFCCPRYECPVSMGTTLNITTTTTTTTTTLPPHFLSHAYKGAAQKKGCQIKGHVYKVGEVIRASSGPCLHCTCGGDGQMKCDPKACTPEPMLRQMIAAAVSSKRRR